jgi:hypothetical protein
MSVIRFRRGYLPKYLVPVDDTMLFQQVTLEEYLDLQYPPTLRESCPEQAQSDRDYELRVIQAITLPGDTLWLWHRVEPWDEIDGAPFEYGGLAVRRRSNVVYAWLGWEGR